MDDAVNAHLISGNLGYESPRFVAESSCRYLKPLAYPTPIDIGLRLSKCVRYLPRLRTRELMLFVSLAQARPFERSVSNRHLCQWC